MEAKSSFRELEVPKTDQLTETDPVKTHKGAPREDEPENKKEPGHGEKAGAKIQGESVEAESSFGELEVPKTDELTETDPVKPHKGVPSQDEPENKTSRDREKLPWEISSVLEVSSCFY